MKQKQKDLQSEIINLLSTGSKHVPTLAASLASHTSSSLQGVYKALRQLKTEEVVSIHNKHVSLSLIWVDAQKKKYEAIQKTYTSMAFLTQLQNGETKSLSFHFSSLNELDLFWTQSFLLLAETTAPEEISYASHPHDWYFYARNETDTYWKQEHVSKGRRSHIIISHATKLDKLVIKKREEDKTLPLAHLYDNPLQQDEYTYYNVIGNYVFIAKLDKTIAPKLNHFIQTQDSLHFSQTSHTALNELLESKSKHTLVIKKSPTQASKIKQTFAKFF